MAHSSDDKKIFWGCFIALITTSMAFSIRAVLANGGAWQAQLGLTSTEAQELFMAGIWPFAISIILFSLVIDKIGYRFAMFFSFGCYAAFVALALAAHGAVGDASSDNHLAYWLLYAGSVILALGNGTVEAFINPVVATIFRDEKSRWLNILHAGWPSGLVVGGILSILLAAVGVTDWRVSVGFIFLPAIVYLIMLFGAKFPVNERVAAGASYREMLAEFGAIGAFIAFFLVFAQLEQVFAWWSPVLTWVLTIATVAGYGVYCRSLGRPLMIILVIIMMPLAITELGTDGAITGLMKRPMEASNWDPAWVLVYTSAIMIFLRFNAGPVIRAFTPLGLLAVAAGLAIVGLYLLSFAHGLVFIFVAATIYGIAKSYFWPTMLGVVAEQCPKGGALTLNAIAGIGMLSVGIVGGPLIGYLQDSAIAEGVQETPYAEQVIVDKEFLLGGYSALDSEAVLALPPEAQTEIEEIVEDKTQGALAKMAVFPAFMLVCYLGLIFYFRSKGGYRAEVIGEEPAH